MACHEVPWSLHWRILPVSPPSVPSGGRMTSRPLNLFSSAPTTVFRLKKDYFKRLDIAHDFPEIVIK